MEPISRSCSDLPWRGRLGGRGRSRVGIAGGLIWTGCLESGAAQIATSEPEGLTTPSLCDVRKSPPSTFGSIDRARG